MQAGILCPNRRQPISLEDINISTDLALCRRCNVTFLYSELQETGSLFERAKKQVGMHVNAGIPTSLKIVALIFIFSGLYSTWNILDAASKGTLSLNFGVLNLFAGMGLLKLNRECRIFALIILWIVMVGLPVLIAVYRIYPDLLSLEILNKEVIRLPIPVSIALILTAYVLSFWEYRVLRRPDIRRLFK